jgi:hypothetical protein
VIAWGVVVFTGLLVIFWDVNPITKAKLMGNPFLIHFIVIGSGLAIHGGSSFPKEQMMDINYFERLNQVNVSAHVEKKGEFSYLSWPYAVAQLRLADSTAFWEIRRFDGLPYLKTETGYFVEVAVTLQGITLSQVHPVLDRRNKPIVEPTCFDINTSIQRCLV